jgi:isochorismate pyruvate lyase
MGQLGTMEDERAARRCSSIAVFQVLDVRDVLGPPGQRLHCDERLVLARASVAWFSGRMSISCDSLDQVRAQIDRLDRQIVALLAERGEYVRQAARFKKTSADVAAPARVEQVIAKVRTLASESGAEPAVVERVYRAMIAAFIETEQAEHARLGG